MSPSFTQIQLTDSHSLDQTAQILLEVSKLVNSTLDPDEVLKLILESVSKILPFDTATIFELKDNFIIAKTCVGFENPESLVGLTLDINKHTIDREVIQMKLPIVIEDVEKDPRWVSAYTSHKQVIRSWMGVPLIAQDKVLGILTLDSHKVNAYNSAHVFIAAAFAAHVSMAFRNAQLYAETKKRINELETINAISSAINRYLDIEKLCVLAGESIRSLYKCDVVYIAILDPDEETITTPYFSIDGVYEKKPPLKVGEGLTSYILKTQKPLVIDTVETDAVHTLGGILRDPRQPRSWVGIPIISGHKPIGVISVQQFNQKNYFSEDDIKLLTIIASTISTAVQNARLFQDSIRRKEEASIIAEIGRQVSASLDLQTVMQKIVQLAFPLLTRTTTAVYLKDSPNHFKAMAATGEDEAIILQDEFTIGEGILGIVAEDKETFIDNDLSQNSLAVHIEGTNPADREDKLMAVPLTFYDELLGILAIWRSPSERKFTARDIQFAESIARQVSVAIYNAKLYDEANRALKEAEQANKYKSQFLANTSHELRTPLNSIINFAYLAQLTIPQESFPEEYDMIKRIENSGRHLLSLINDILDLAKIEAGKFQLNFEDFNPQDEIEAVIETIHGYIKDKPIQLRKNYSLPLPYIHADPVRFKQILFNLLSNAAKFTRKGSIFINIKTVEEFLQISVKDTGIGMKHEDIPKAFDEFLQLNGELSREAGGTGLGLPISKKFVELQGGSIWIESEPDVGTEIFFTTRLSTIQPSVKESEDIYENMRNILVVDDDPNFTTFASWELQSSWEVIATTHSEETLELTKKHKPRVIFLDIFMPELSGWQVIEMLSKDSETSTIPIVICSVRQDEPQIKAMQIFKYLEKPIDAETIQSILHDISPTGGTALIVDDDPSAIDILRHFIIDGKFTIDTASTGNEGLQKITSMKPNCVVLLDIMLPDIDGFTIVNRILENKKEHPLIILTSCRDLTKEEYTFITKNNIFYLPKSQFSRNDIVRVIKKAKARYGGKNESQT